MRRQEFLPYNQPEVGDDEVRAVTAAIMSRWITRGPTTQQFEDALANYLGVPHVVAVSSCTAALHLALLAANIGPGDEVITTPMTFAASVNVIIHTGATPVLADIELDTGNINPDAVEAAITDRTRALLPVHYAGHAADMARLNEIRGRYGLTVIEDAAHALASRQHGRLIGGFGNLTAFSFYATKNLATGEGGALVVPQREMAEAIRMMSLHGMSRNAWTRYSREGGWEYDITMPGFKYNMTDINAAMGLAQLQKLSAMQRKRTQLADRYRQGLQGLPLTLPTVRDGFEHSWHLYPIRLNGEARDRADVIEDLRRDNVGTSVHFIPIHYHTYYQQRFGWRPGDFPRAEEFFRGQISLPLYPTMSLDDVDDVVRALARNLNRSQRQPGG